MKRVNIGDLKARLSAHLRLVREGEEVLVCDRNKPVARIVAVEIEDQLAQEKRLIAKGVLIPPRKKRGVRGALPKPSGYVSQEVMDRIWREEREGR